MDSIRLFGITSVRDGKKNTSPAAYGAREPIAPRVPQNLYLGKVLNLPP
jgi:hypothetical protein